MAVKNLKEKLEKRKREQKTGVKDYSAADELMNIFGIKRNLHDNIANDTMQKE